MTERSSAVKCTNKYNATNYQRMAIDCLLNQITFEFDGKTFELMYDYYECKLYEFDESYNCRQIYCDIEWSSEKCKQETNNEKLSNVCNEVYEYFLCH